jgi:hypothetical protein
LNDKNKRVVNIVKKGWIWKIILIKINMKVPKE